MTDTTDPQPFPIWVVWREEEPPYGYFATEEAAKTATIDCWEEEEPSCPDYGWGPDGPRWELLAGGEAAGVFVSRHLVYGAPASAPSAPADRAGLRERIAAVIHEDLTQHKVRRDLGLLGIVPRLTDAVLSELPPAVDRAAEWRAAAVFVEAMNEGCGRKPCDACTTREDVASELRRVADEEQADTEAPHPFNGRLKAPRHAAVAGICTDCHHHETATCHAAAPVAGQPPADTGEEARPRFVRVCIACPECDHTLDENSACANGCHDKGPRP